MVKRARDKHSRYSPSGSVIWMACPGSVGLSRFAPREETSKYAEEGIAAHAYAEDWIEHLAGIDGKTIDDMQNRDPDLDRHLRAYVDFAYESIKLVRKTGGSFWSMECVLEYKSSVPDIFGTVDFIFYDASKRLLSITDLKFGVGINVKPKDNTQMLLYALMAMQMQSESKGAYTKPRAVELRIEQPRNGGTKTHRYSLYEMMQWKEAFDDAITRTVHTPTRLVSGNHCRFCKAAPICPALREVAGSFRAEMAVPVQNKSLNETVSFLDRAPQVKLYIKKMEESALKLARSGTKIPGYKLVYKRAYKKFKTPHEAKEFLITVANVHPSKVTKEVMCSPAEARRLSGKKYTKELDALTFTPNSDTKLVHQTDPGVEVELGKPNSGSPEYFQVVDGTAKKITQKQYEEK